MKVISPPDGTPEDEQYFGLVVSRDEAQLIKDIFGDSTHDCLYTGSVYEALKEYFPTVRYNMIDADTDEMITGYDIEDLDNER